MFAVERITEPATVRGSPESIAENDDAVAIARTRDGPAPQILAADGPTIYKIRNRYIADGQLKHRDWARNTDPGPIAFGASVNETGGDAP